jgi:GTP-binding protein
VEERKVYRHETKNDNQFTISRDNEAYVVESVNIEKLIKRTNFGSPEAVLRFARILRKMGIDKALRERGAKDGDTIRIGDLEFEFSEKE